MGKQGSVLFVGTKRQARDAICEEAERCGMFYVNHRWLGGMLTNHETIKKSIRRLKRLERMEEDGKPKPTFKGSDILDLAMAAPSSEPMLLRLTLNAFHPLTQAGINLFDNLISYGKLTGANLAA